jgi:hypothetical protein
MKKYTSWDFKILGQVAKEYTVKYTGEKDFLGKGTIVVVQDHPKNITMKISDANKALN